MKTTELPTQPWQDLAADLFGPLRTSDYLLVIVDYYNRFLEVAVTMLVLTSKMISCLGNMFATQGIPLFLKTENGRKFVSEEFQTYFKDNDVAASKR